MMLLVGVLAGVVAIACAQAEGRGPDLDDAILSIHDVPSTWYFTPVAPEDRVMGAEFAACAGGQLDDLPGALLRVQSPDLIGPIPNLQLVRSEATAYRSEEDAESALTKLSGAMETCGAVLTKSVESGFLKTAEERGLTEEYALDVRFVPLPESDRLEGAQLYRMEIGVDFFGLRGIQDYVFCRAGRVLGVLSYFGGPEPDPARRALEESFLRKLRASD
jgi:hypothetical protein